jgi:hypothetical protein
LLTYAPVPLLVCPPGPSPLQLKLGLNPLQELPDGPYLPPLTHLDLRGARLVTLPQV